MILTAGFLVVLLTFALSTLLVYLGQADAVRAERAYWDAKANRPELYDWERDLGA